MFKLSCKRRVAGFTLLEVAIVMIVIGYLLNQLVVPFGAQREQTLRGRAQQQLNTVIDNVVGYAISHHRLPCPAGDNTHGFERSSCKGDLSIGYVPVATLGLRGPTDNQGRLLDSWGRPLIYVVSPSDHPQRGEQGKPDYLTEGEMGNVGLAYLNSALTICRRVKANSCTRADVRANQVPLIVMSLGSDDSRYGQQTYNQNTGPIFVSQPMTLTKDKRFDDLVTWLSESELIFNLVRAGTL